MTTYLLKITKGNRTICTADSMRKARIMARGILKDGIASVIYIYESHRYTDTLVGLVREGDRPNTYTYGKYGGSERYLKNDGTLGRIIR